MGTPAAIVYKDEHGMYHGSRVNYDGNTLFPILNKNYNTYDLVKELISFGEISCLYERIHPTPGIEHTFDYDKREKGVCIFYHRDRGEKIMKLGPTESLYFIKKNFQFVYLFEDGEWTRYSRWA
jgi:hypothetical protein